MFIENIKNEVINVLIVDDDLGLLDLLKTVLEDPRNNMKIFIAQSAPEALELLKEKKFHVIVSDYMMPEMNGLEFFKKIRTEENNTPFILLTGRGDQKIIISALNAGINGYILKGGDIRNRFEELILQIKKVISDHEMKEECKKVLKNAPVGIFYSSFDGQIFSANPEIAKILGYSNPEELVQNTIIELYCNINDREKIINDLLSKKEEWTKYPRISWKKKDNQIIAVDLTLRSVCNTDNETAYFEGFVEDVTELKKSEEAIQKQLIDIEKAKEALEQANYRLELMSQIIRHDIGNLLMVIIAYLGMIKIKISKPELDDDFQVIESAAMSINEQIKFMKLYQEIGTKKPGWQNFQKKIPKILQPGIINLIVDVPKNLEIFSDMMIEKVFENLLDNSLRHGQKVSQIKVSAISLESDELIIVWEDNGIGVPKEDKEKIFRQGFGKNTGLGLHLIKKILGITGIKIQETGEYEKGARFEILVPKNKYRISEDE
ncbi:MAG: response regulator [Candidatus Paceibacterota bacterium]